jgi:hypothetical protein
MPYRGSFCPTDGVAVALLSVEYVRIASVLGCGVSLSGTVSIWFLYAK